MSARTPAPLLAELERIGEALRGVTATWSGPKRSIAQLDDVAVSVKQAPPPPAPSAPAAQSAGRRAWRAVPQD